MRKAIEYMVRSCMKYQKAKIFKYTKPPICTFSDADSPFAHIHDDFIRPFSSSDGNQYRVNITNKFMRWPEVIPTPHMQKPLFVHRYTARYSDLESLLL